MPDLALDPSERELADLDRLIGDALAGFSDDLEAAARDGVVAELDPGYVDRWRETARTLSVRVSNDLPPQVGPEATGEIRGIIVNLLDRIEHVDPERPLDTIDEYFVGAEAVRHMIRDALDEHVDVPDDDAAHLVSFLKGALPRITQAEQARLAGISTRQLQRLAKAGATPPRRLALAARLVKLLRFAWTPEGAVAWFHRPRTALDGRAPIDLMEDPDAERSLLRLARQGRAQHAA